MNTKAIQSQMKAIKGIGKITKTMEMVSVAKMRRTSKRAEEGRPYEVAVRELVASIPSNIVAQHSLVEDRVNATGQVIVFVAADKGLCGGYNSQLIRTLSELVRKNPDSKIVTVGKTADKLVRRTGASIIASFGMLPELLDTGEVAAIAHYVVNLYRSDTSIRSITVLSQWLETKISSKPVQTPLLPISSIRRSSDVQLSTEYRIEPNAPELLSTLLPGYVESELFQIILEARAAEHTTRMIAMKSASDNATEYYKELNVSFNRLRQASITQEIAEIIGGASV